MKKPLRRKTILATQPQAGSLSWWTAWAAFWFTPSDPALLGILRILDRRSLSVVEC